MKFKNFTYKKKGFFKSKDYLVLITREDQTHLGGIDLGKLNDKEIEDLVSIQKEYETNMKPLIKKAYRLYIKENIADENDTSDPQQLLDFK